ncbi:lysophospholipid acyltransferase family protein [Xanthobacter autotrophicus]|uniref:lysophospholipid acyltransferase family protein n=1 Tax=Xanthobacter autotrophicus TaxID=280 RepID=UPI003D7FD336
MSAGPTETPPPARPRQQRFLARVVGTGVLLFAHFITAVRGKWDGVAPDDEQRIYFANHASHGDFVLVWAVLPPRMRRKTRPVAGADYWLTSALRRFIGRDVFNAVLIERDRVARTSDPIGLMAQALDEGASLILFPEGTRNVTDAPLLPFKSGLYHLARMRRHVSLVPTWIDNLNRVMPKGEFVPIPLICTVTFGAALHMGEGESKQAFLDRAEAALLSLSVKADTP